MTRYSSILAELYAKYKYQPVFDDFVRVFDIGVPLAYLTHMGFASSNVSGDNAIEEAWEGLCKLLDLPADHPWESFDQMLDASPNVREK